GDDELAATTLYRASLVVTSDLHDVTAPRLPLEQRVEGGRQLFERNLARRLDESGRLQVRRQPAPHFEAHRHRTHDGIDAEQLHAAQDEWQHRGLQLGAAGQARARDA